MNKKLNNDEIINLINTHVLEDETVNDLLFQIQSCAALTKDTKIKNLLAEFMTTVILKTIVQTAYLVFDKVDEVDEQDEQDEQILVSNVN